MGDDAPEIRPKIKQWIEECKNVTEPHFSDVNKVVLKVKGIVAKSKL